MNERQIPTQGEILERLNDVDDLQDRALVIFAYLTAGRANEICGTVRKRDIFFTQKSERPVMLVTMPNLKNRIRSSKQLPVPLDREGVFVSMFVEYLGRLNDEDTLFPFCSRTGREKLKRICGFDFRYMRHIRLTHLVVLYDFNEQLLIRFAGWTDGRPAKYYIELRWVDFLSKF